MQVNASWKLCLCKCLLLSKVKSKFLTLSPPTNPGTVMGVQKLGKISLPTDCLTRKPIRRSDPYRLDPL